MRDRAAFTLRVSMVQASSAIFAQLIDARFKIISIQTVIGSGRKY